nr:hypothetical protein [Candidatus Njordarchaeota archaeon]
MVEAVELEEVITVDEEATEEFFLEQLLSRLFLYKEVEFFDAEPDEEFFRILDNSVKVSVDEQRTALDDFRRHLRLGDEFEGEYAKLGEIVVHSDDFEEHGKIPLLVFALNSGDILAGSNAASFGIKSFDVVYSGHGSFVIVLYVKNTADSHMEIYLRFPKQEALNVVGTILRVFEDYVGCTEQGNQVCFNPEDEFHGSLIEQTQPNCNPIPACHTFKFQERNAKDSSLEQGHQYFN